MVKHHCSLRCSSNAWPSLSYCLQRVLLSMCGISMAIRPSTGHVGTATRTSSRYAIALLLGSPAHLPSHEPVKNTPMLYVDPASFTHCCFIGLLFKERSAASTRESARDAEFHRSNLPLLRCALLPPSRSESSAQRVQGYVFVWTELLLCKSRNYAMTTE